MHRKRLLNINILLQSLSRYVLIFISAFWSLSQPCQAQKSIAEQLEYIIYEDQDLTRGQQLYERITPEDIKAMPDSVLFNYHYLGGYINSEIPNHSKAIEHLLEARKLCETSIGTHSIPFMEIVWGLGNEYCEIGKYEDALAVYQDGIIKSMAVREAVHRQGSNAFSNLIMGVQDCYEHLGLFNEVPTQLLDAWGFWAKDGEPFDTDNYYPLWTLQYFYWRYEMYDDALSISDKILDFITKQATAIHPEMADALYMRGKTLAAMGKQNEAIEVFEKALSVLRFNKNDAKELYGLICGNLLSSHLQSGLTDFEPILKEIKSFGVRARDTSIFKNALYSSANTLNKRGDYTIALALNQRISDLNLTQEETAAVENQRKEITYNQDVTAALGESEQQRGVLTKGSREWFENMHRLSNAYNLKREQEKNLDVLNEMHHTCISFTAVGDEYMIWVLNNLLGICLEQDDYDNALKYAIEKWKYVSSKTNMPDNIIYDALNNLIVVKMKAGILDGIDDELKRIGDYYQIQFGKRSPSYAMFLHNRGRAYQMQGKLENAKQTLLQAITLQKELDGKPMGRTVKYLMEVQKQLDSRL